MWEASGEGMVASRQEEPVERNASDMKVDPAKRVSEESDQPDLGQLSFK